MPALVLLTLLLAVPPEGGDMALGSAREAGGKNGAGERTAKVSDGGVGSPGLVECPVEAEATSLGWEPRGAGIEYAKAGWGKPVKEGVRQRGPLPVAFHLVRVSLSEAGEAREAGVAGEAGEAGEAGGLTLRALRIPDRSGKVEEMVAWARGAGETIVAAVNGDYYPPGQVSRDPLGLLVSEGRMLAAGRGTTGLLLDSQNRVHVGMHPVQVHLLGPGFAVEVADMNRKAGRNEAILTAGRYRRQVDAQWGCCALRLMPPLGEPMVNRTVPVTVVAAGDAGRMRKCEADEYLLVACGRPAELLTAVGEQTPLFIRIEMPDVDWVPAEALSGGPRILRDGIVGIETREEGLTAGMKGWVPKRHPRTAVGVSLDGRTVILLVAEGRLPHTEGMTAVEAACVLKAAGATDALLFDGGGSSSLLLGDRFVNKPQMWHNRSGRSVADTLAVVRMRPEQARAVDNPVGRRHMPPTAPTMRVPPAPTMGEPPAPTMGEPTAPTTLEGD